MLRILVNMTLLQIFLIWLYEWRELINLALFYSISLIKNEKRHLVDVDTHSTLYVQNQPHTIKAYYCVLSSRVVYFVETLVGRCA